MVEEPTHIRPSVMKFAFEMEKVLRRHDDKKDGWGRCTLGYLRDRAVEEAFEYWRSRSSNELIDVANFLMMLWHRETGTKLYK